METQARLHALKGTVGARTAKREDLIEKHRLQLEKFSSMRGAWGERSQRRFGMGAGKSGVDRSYQRAEKRRTAAECNQSC